MRRWRRLKIRRIAVTKFRGSRLDGLFSPSFLFAITFVIASFFFLLPTVSFVLYFLLIAMFLFLFFFLVYNLHLSVQLQHLWACGLHTVGHCSGVALCFSVDKCCDKQVHHYNHKKRHAQKEAKWRNQLLWHNSDITGFSSSPPVHLEANIVQSVFSIIFSPVTNTVHSQHCQSH